MHDEIGDCYLSKAGCTMRRHPKLTFYKMGTNCSSPQHVGYKGIYGFSGHGGSGHGEAMTRTTTRIISVTTKTI